MANVLPTFYLGVKRQQQQPRANLMLLIYEKCRLAILAAWSKILPNDD